jgi:hypothetical protein
MPAESREQVEVVCEACGRRLGQIRNFLAGSRLRIRVACPCGGFSAPIDLSEVYEAVPAAPTDREFREIVRQAIRRARESAGATS